MTTHSWHPLTTPPRLGSRVRSVARRGPSYLDPLCCGLAPQLPPETGPVRVVYPARLRRPASLATEVHETCSGTGKHSNPEWTDDGVESGRFEAEGGTVRLRPTSSREMIVSKIEKPYMFGYVRVSTEEQAESRNGIEAQEAVLRAEAERRGWDLEVFRDEGKSGKFVNEGLREVLDLLGSGQGDGLVVAKMDRLARSVIHAATITERAQKQGWSLVVIDLNLDFTTASGRLMGHMLMSFAEFERGVIGERTSAALAAKKRRGEPVGRTCAAPAPIVRRIVMDRRAGQSFARIARALTNEGVLSPTGLDSWQSSSVRRIYTSAAAKEAAQATHEQKAS